MHAGQTAAGNITLSRVVRLMDGNIGKVVQENVKRIETEEHQQKKRKVAH